MRRFALLIAFFAAACMAAPAAMAQTTVVSGTVADADGFAYAGATINFTLNASNATVTINDQKQCQAAGAGSAPCQLPISGFAGPVTLDNNGHFTYTLYSNTSITPAATQWTFNVRFPGIDPPVGTGPQMFSVAITVTGATQDVSSALNAAAPLLTNIFGSGSPSCLKDSVNTEILFNDAGTCAGDPNLTWLKGPQFLVIDGAIGLTGFINVTGKTGQPNDIGGDTTFSGGVVTVNNTDINPSVSVNSTFATIAGDGALGLTSSCVSLTGVNQGCIALQGTGTDAGTQNMNEIFGVEGLAGHLGSGTATAIYGGNFAASNGSTAGRLDLAVAVLADNFSSLSASGESDGFRAKDVCNGNVTPDACSAIDIEAQTAPGQSIVEKTGAGLNVLQAVDATAVNSSTYVQAGNFTIGGTLPAAAAGNAGQWRTVTNSTTVAVEGQTCTATGSGVIAAAFSNGTVWKCF